MELREWVGRALGARPLLFNVRLFSLVNRLFANNANGGRRPFEKILVIAVGGVGDLVMTTPTLRALRKAHPEAEITLLKKRKSGEILAQCPYIDRFLDFPGRDIFRLRKRSFAYFQELAGQQFDLVIGCHESFGGKYRWLYGKALSYLTHAPRRIGFRTPVFDRHRSSAGFLLSDVVDNHVEHGIKVLLRLLEPLGVCPDGLHTEVYPTSDDETPVEHLLKRRGVGGYDVLVGINTNTSPRKNWGLRRVVELAFQLNWHLGAKIVLTGTQRIEGMFPTGADILPGAVIDLTRRTSISELCVLIRRCDLYVTPDSGPSHIAMAVGTPVVILFGPTRPSRYGPLGHSNVAVVCAEDRRVSSISESRVMRAAEQLLGDNPKLRPVGRDARSAAGIDELLNMPSRIGLDSRAEPEGAHDKISTRELLRELRPPILAERRGEAPPARILIIRGGKSLGDILMLTPALRGIARRHPKAQIHIFGRKRPLAMIAGTPSVQCLPAPYTRDRHVLRELRAQYDLVYDLHYGKTLGTPEGVGINAYELHAHYLEAPSPPYRPEFRPTPKESKRARALFEAYAPKGATRGVVALHLESGALNRTFPVSQGTELACELVARGWSVIVLGLQREWAQALRGIDGVFCFHDIARRSSARVIFSLIRFADLFIGVDGVCSHIAQAFGVPSVILYGPIAPYLRAKYFEKVRTLCHAEPCGPCQQSSMECVRFPGRIAPCMEAFSVDEILEATDEVLSGASPGPFPYDMEVGRTRRPCPCCQEEEAAFLTQKSIYRYWKCKRCGSFYVGNPPDPVMQVQRYRRYYRRVAPIYREDLNDTTAPLLATALTEYASTLGVRERYLLDVGSGPGLLQRHLSAIGWSGVALEPALGFDEIETPPGWTVRQEMVEQYLARQNGSFRMITFVNSLTSLIHPAPLLGRLREKLSERGVVVAIFPSSDFAREGNLWLPLNSVFAGMHTVLPSRQGIEALASRAGFDCLVRPMPVIEGYLAALVK